MPKGTPIKTPLQASRPAPRFAWQPPAPPPAGPRLAALLVRPLPVLGRGRVRRRSRRALAFRRRRRAAVPTRLLASTTVRPEPAGSSSYTPGPFVSTSASEPSARSRRSSIGTSGCAVLTANLIALALFGLGLLAPLTPSEGTPTWRELLVHGGVPVALVAGSTVLVRSAWAKAMLVVEAVYIIAFEAWLLRIQR